MLSCTMVLHVVISVTVTNTLKQLLVCVFSLSSHFLILSTYPHIDCIYVIHNAGTPSFFVFSWCISSMSLTDMKPCTWSSTLLSSSPFVRVLPLSILRMVPYKEGRPGIYRSVSYAEFGVYEFSHSSKILFSYFFFQLCLIPSAANILNICNFPFCPNILVLSWFGWPIPSVISFFFSLFYHEHGRFFNVKVHSYILAIHFYRFYQEIPILFFIFGKPLDVVHIYKVIDLFSWFCKFEAFCALLQSVIERIIAITKK